MRKIDINNMTVLRIDTNTNKEKHSLSVWKKNMRSKDNDKTLSHRQSLLCFLRLVCLFKIFLNWNIKCNTNLHKKNSAFVVNIKEWVWGNQLVIITGIDFRFFTSMISLSFQQTLKARCKHKRVLRCLLIMIIVIILMHKSNEQN